VSANCYHIAGNLKSPPDLGSPGAYDRLRLKHLLISHKAKGRESPAFCFITYC
jgi:hypothetical protein